MKKILTTHLLVKNHKDVIANCLQSISALGSQILVGNLGSTDGTAEYCAKFGAKVIRAHGDDYAKIRNKLIDESDTERHFYIEPWERLALGHNIIKEDSGGSKLVQVIEGQNVSKSLRLWSKLKFQNPVYETLWDDKATELSGVTLVAKPWPRDIDADLKIIDRWKLEAPTSPQPFYYQAHCLLTKRRFDEFLIAADNYLFREKTGMAAVMMRYHKASILFYILNSNESIKEILSCLAAKPLMAEFWCLLADIYYKLRKYDKAKELYQNAVLLGSRRLPDSWPYEVSKYQDYPAKMMASCEDIIKNSTLFVVRND